MHVRILELLLHSEFNKILNLRCKNGFNGTMCENIHIKKCTTQKKDLKGLSKIFFNWIGAEWNKCGDIIEINYESLERFTNENVGVMGSTGVSIGVTITISILGVIYKIFKYSKLRKLRREAVFSSASIL